LAQIEELALLPRAEYERLTALAAEAEEKADVAAYDAAMAEMAAGREGPLPAEVCALLLRGAGHHRPPQVGRCKGASESLEAIAKGLTCPRIG
jgi:hypothetical protein